MEKADGEFSFFKDDGNAVAASDGFESPKPMGDCSSAPAAILVPVAKTDVKLNSPKPKPKRNRVPLEKGYSQLDWMKLTESHPDLAGLGGRSNRRMITMEEVRQHKKADDAWTVLNGRVYNITPYLSFHPGGMDMLMKAAGKDCTSLFNKYHTWVNADFLLARCLLGALDLS